MSTFCPNGPFPVLWPIQTSWQSVVSSKTCTTFELRHEKTCLAICEQQRRRSALSLSLRIVNRELRIVNRESWTVNCESWTVNCESWTVNHEHWTVSSPPIPPPFLCPHALPCLCAPSLLPISVSPLALPLPPSLPCACLCVCVCVSLSLSFPSSLPPLSLTANREPWTASREP